MEPKRVEGTRKRLLAALGVPMTRTPTEEQIQNIRAGTKANGREIDAAVYRMLNSTKDPGDATWVRSSSATAFSIYIDRICGK